VEFFFRYAPAHIAASSTMRQLPSLLGNARVVVLPKKEEADTSYRARLIGLDETGACHVWEELKKNNFSCIAIPPRGKVSACWLEVVGGSDKQIDRAEINQRPEKFKTSSESIISAKSKTSAAPHRSAQAAPPDRP
jgi:hypothetical protein